MAAVSVGSALVAVHTDTTPAADTVSPGIAGFLAIFVLALATVVLIRSMVGHLRKVRYGPDGPDGPDGEPAGGATGAPDTPDPADGADHLRGAGGTPDGGGRTEPPPPGR